MRLFIKSGRVEIMRSGCEHKRKSTEMSLTLSAQVNEYGIDAKVDSSKKISDSDE